MDFSDWTASDYQKLFEDNVRLRKAILRHKEAVLAASDEQLDDAVFDEELWAEA